MPIEGRYPHDTLYLIGFSDYARQLKPEDLTAPGLERTYGTNMQHAFMLAGRLLAQHPRASRQVIMVTDGEPTAHLEGSEAFFAWPPEPETIQLTLAEAMRLLKSGVQLNIFMLEESEGLARFMERLATAHLGSRSSDGRRACGRLHPARLRGRPRPVGSGAPRWVRVLVPVAVFTACAGVGAFIASTFEPVPPGRRGPWITSDDATVTPSVAQAGDLVTVNRSYEPRTCSSVAVARRDWTIELRVGVDDAGRVRAPARLTSKVDLVAIFPTVQTSGGGSVEVGAATCGAPSSTSAGS